jgi:PAS domain S-box-containing protein
VWYAGCIGVTAGLYYGSARAGLRLAYLHGAVTALWPPVGVGIAALVLGGLRLWPGIVIGDLLAGDFSTPLGTVLGQTVGNTLEVVIAAIVLVRVARRRVDFERVRDVGALVVAAALGTVVSAGIGVISLRLGHVIAEHEVLTVWRTWWLSDFSGALVVTPLLLTWAIRRLSGFGVAQIVEGLAGVVVLVLLVELPSQGDVPYIVFPALIWAALRFGPRGAATATALVSTLSVWNTAHNSGPFVRASITHSLLSTQLFIAAAALTSLVLAAATAERVAAGQAVEERLGELARERNFVTTVVDVSPSFFCQLRTDGTVVRFNETLARTRGIRDDETARGRPFWDVFVSPEDAGAVRDALLGRRPGEHEHLWIGRTGPRVVAWQCVPIEDAQGEPRLLVCGLDVTHRYEQQEELRRQRDFLTTVGRSTPSLLCVVHADGTVDEASVNAAFTRATGYDEEEVVGRVFWDLVIPEEHAAQARAAFLTAVRERKDVRIETPWRSADGSPLLVEWRTASLADWREGAYLICGVDVTERTAQAEEIKRSRSRLVEAGDAERRRLERNLHDGAQQRLVTLSLVLRLARAKLRSSPDASDELLAGAEGELATALQELRELARGLHPAVLSDRGLEPALASLAQRSPIPVDVRLDCDERLPHAIEVASFYVVSEALTNVAKYAHATSVEIHVQQTNTTLELEVADDGIGGAAAADGSGLRGLADRVHALDGRFRVDSRPGAGTRIRVQLPLRPTPDPVTQVAR